MLRRLGSLRQSRPYCSNTAEPGDKARLCLCRGQDFLAADPAAAQPVFLCAETTVRRVEDAFKDYTQREDIAILLINQHVANLIRHLINNYTRARSAFPLTILAT